MTVQNTGSAIHILDQATVNQIAAGEVVERPASVVKELVENAIDAGARSIRIDITTSAEGIGSIQVTDDGCGMSPSDAVLAFTPHATSKILRIEDLNTLHTLGFRGEALASIAAVARVTLTTRSREPGIIAGIKVVAEGGKILQTCDIGVPQGTSIQVQDLFFNTPARKKFQKSRNTELANIYSLLEGICLTHPEISFRVVTDRNNKIITDRSSKILDTIARIFGSPTVKDLIPVDASFPLVKISGYISRPALTRKDTSRIMVFINQRYVSSTTIGGAVILGYGTLLPKDRFPIAFLSLTIDPHLVDVNVHPAKKLVRLSHEKEIASSVTEAVNTVLLQHDLIPGIVAPSRPYPVASGEGPGPDTVHAYDPGTPAPYGVSETTHAGTLVTDRQLRQTELATGSVPLETRLPVLDVIGQFGGIYILATTETGDLVIIDQHAVHERILYELVNARMSGDHCSQELIVPFILHRSVHEAAVLRDLIPALAQAGLILEEFGKETFLVRAIPVVLGKPEDM
ncbi:MAG TPA: DNA mismatch repair endonuclease MutL, partial [Methanoregula sp.]|nr:DNA mismatch repair endonuclease MutL [Methanoregula sp.]